VRERKNAITTFLLFSVFSSALFIVADLSLSSSSPSSSSPIPFFSELLYLSLSPLKHTLPLSLSPSIYGFLKSEN
jgi:hypothetical protein